jgi:hypothetical protein
MFLKKAWRQIKESKSSNPELESASIWEQGHGFVKLSDINETVENLLKQAKDAIKHEQDPSASIQEIRHEQDRISKYVRHAQEHGKDTFQHQELLRTISDKIAEVTQKQLNEKEIIKGGLADHKSLQDIAKKHNVSLEEITKEYEMGLKVEKEHTNSKAKAAEIAKDHLMENPKYYSKLKAAKIDEAAPPQLAFGDDDEFIIEPDKVQEYVDEVSDLQPNEAVEYLSQMKSKIEKNLPRLETKLAHYKGSYNPANPSEGGQFSTLINTLMKAGKNQKGATSSIGQVHAPFQTIDDAVNAFFMTDDERLEKFINYLQVISQAKITATDPTLKYGSKEKGGQTLGSTARRRPMKSQLTGEFDRKPEDTEAKSKGMKLGPFQRFDIMHGPLFGPNIQDENAGWHALSQINDKLNKGENISIDEFNNAAKYFNGSIGKLLRFVLLHDTSVINEPINKMITKYHDQVITVNQIKEDIAAINKAIQTVAQKPEEQFTESTMRKGRLNWNQFKKDNYSKKA